MRMWNVVGKSFKEQLRSFWVMLLTLSMGPFFIFVYFLIIESSKVHYDVAILNQDKGVRVDEVFVEHGQKLIASFEEAINDTMFAPFSVKKISDYDQAIKQLKNKEIDALIEIPVSFSESIESGSYSNISPEIEIGFTGDLTSVNYLLSGIWAGEVINQFMRNETGMPEVVKIKETPLGFSAQVDDFDLVVPGILIVSIIMLMFTATLAFINEVEYRTIIRLKLSKVKAFEFIGGTFVVQLLVGIVGVILSFVTALMMGFNSDGSILLFLLIAVLTSISIIAFSLIIAAYTKTANEVLIVGNFPLFLFMFFTGAAFPMKASALYTLWGYPVNFQGLMSPTHAISALNKVLIMNMGFWEIVPELIAIVVVTLLYFVIGLYAFRKRHLALV